ncbi:hypothetical protein [Virgibacillus sp. DJP39]|uniref:hypothetical protein n=1 Tax=Virgibacillus sp. DJP39 TaxID=3409790 RepID=UPI003BB58F9A
MKTIDAYFKTESDAESVKAKLETLKVEQVLVERVPEFSRDKVTEILKNLFTNEPKDSHDPQVLHVEIADEDYGEADKIIRESNGYISME